MPRPAKECRKASPPRSPLESPVATPVKETKAKDSKVKDTPNQANRGPKSASKASKKRKVDVQVRGLYLGMNQSISWGIIVVKESNGKLNYSSTRCRMD